MNVGMKHYILLFLIAWNLAVFFLYAADKRGSRRISERTLILCAFLLGGAGAISGVCLLRHKTRHLKFRVLVPLSFLLTVAAIVLVLPPEIIT